jgi:decaprenyl-phosphate phosphoribosyltransferase
VAGAFAAFSVTASAFYLINDVRDVESDRQHPVKQMRPIAAGRLSISLALTAAGGLLLAGVLGSYLVAPWLVATILGYAALQSAYNLGLKEQPVLDIMVIAGGSCSVRLGERPPRAYRRLGGSSSAWAFWPSSWAWRSGRRS